MPTKQVAAPMIGDIHSSREKLLVTIRAEAAGITSRAEISSVPITRMVTKIVNESITKSIASIAETGTPETWATSRSNVENKSRR